MTKRPNSLRHLDDAIRRMCAGSPEEFIKTRTLMANAIVAQMLPDGVVKGGSAIKMRFGDTVTRFTTDLDTATTMPPDLYAEQLNEALTKGWEVMRPFDVKLSYSGKPWCTVPLEVGYNEIGDAEETEWVRLYDVEKIFAELGFPALNEVPLMPLSYQIAQKIHALTSGSDRVRDLIDLQLIASNATIDLKATRRTCERLFAYRKMQAWPPTVEKQTNWEELYAAQSIGLPVEQNLDRACAWANNFIKAIETR